MSRDFLRRWAFPLLAVPLLMLGCEAARKAGHRIAGHMESSGRPGAAKLGHAAIAAGAEMQQAKHYSDLSEQEEYYLGRSTAAHLFADHPREADAEALTGYVARIGTTLAAASSRPETFLGYRFAVVRSDEVNAFSAPGGFIFVTTGTIRSARNEDELAGVIAHEIAHVAERHALQVISDAHLKAGALTITRGVGEAAAARRGSHELGPVAKFAEGLIGDIVEATKAGFGRKKEAEADRIAVEMMAAAGYDPTAFAEFLSRMQEHEKRGGWFSTNRSLHPPVAERVSDVRTRCARSGWKAVPHAERDARFATLAAPR